MRERSGQPREVASGWQRVVPGVRDDSYTIVWSCGVLSPENPTLANALTEDAPVLVVTTPSVDRLYGQHLRRYLSLRATHTSPSYLVLDCSEASKSMEQVLAVCERAATSDLGRQSQLVCVGGGVSLDIVSLAAALFRRGVPHVRVPTTLIGMVDAGIGVKSAVNFAGSKSMLGTFTPPEACIIDPSFLATLPRRHLQAGLAECIKVALVSSAPLFEEIEARAEGLLDADVGLSQSPADAEKLVELAARTTIDELELNLFERPEIVAGRRGRKLDFGHTFSPWIEEASHHAVLHGEAVAIDVALSTELAHMTGVIDGASRSRVLDLLRCVGLPVYWPGIDPRALHVSLESVARRRHGQLNLVVPAGIGHAAFLNDLATVSSACLEKVCGRLTEVCESSVC